MLNRVKAALAARRGGAEPEAGVDHAAEAHAFFSAKAAAMPPVVPPAAVNDDPMAGVTEVVERELRVAGYLR